MYRDEYGNIWASYEAYQSYLNDTNNNLNTEQKKLEELVSNIFDGVYIDDNGLLWKNKDSYIESGKNNE